MNWNAIGAVGQILGSLATFVTVGFLAVQVHDTEADMRRSLSQSRIERTIDLNIAYATNERLVTIREKANAALQGDKPLPPYMSAATKQLGLTMEEAISLYTHLVSGWAKFAQTVPYVDDLLPADRARFDRTARFAMSEPVFRFWYEFAKPTLNPIAIRYADNLMAQTP